uniref:IBR domain-containing protein n=1 Tax=Cucumis sativus TaxID=3659 RepID=A0A0A0KUV8_CUCSA
MRPCKNAMELEKTLFFVKWLFNFILSLVIYLVYLTLAVDHKRKAVRIIMERTLKEASGIMKLAEEMKWKRCPDCKNLVERIGGCSHIICICGSHFCYTCGTHWSPHHECPI